MTQERKIPDPETRRRSIERLRESNRQLELFTLALDELIATVETDIRRQRRVILERKHHLARLSSEAGTTQNLYGCSDRAGNCY
ncbi:MAG: hypothetical protein KME17_18625 [Cyanosarcina radialis HA8281-LM2]|jgi:hypothetical protein|nr:hypothetical protein [Cyanosarcina radialis HA8281-LM2]